MSGPANHQRPFWKSLSKLDWAALAVIVLGIWAGWSGNPLQGDAAMRFLRFLALLALFYFAYRFWSRWRAELLWSLRNRLIVAYVFIAVVPILLLVILAGRAREIIYAQLGSYILHEEIHRRVDLLADSAAHIAAAEETLPASINQKTLEKSLAAQLEVAEGKALPGLVVSFHVPEDYFRKFAGPKARSYAGLVQTENQLRLASMREMESPRGKEILELSVPVTPEFLESVATDLGPFNMLLLRRVNDGSTGGDVTIGTEKYRVIGRVTTHKRSLPPATSWTDPVVDDLSILEVSHISADGVVVRAHPVFASYEARISQLNRRIFGLVGEFSLSKVTTLILISIGFLLLEVAALIIGIVLTRAITRTVSELYRATQFVQEGNFSYRVSVERKDQLGALGDSFNSMTSSITNLINEQKQLQRLENEISIAREVQDQLFPRNLPHVAGVEIEAICRAARSVSGDYYDFIQLSPTHVAIAIADISGKGISAALLMASLQAALRSQLLVPGSETLSTAELVARLNTHLVRNTGDDRFATFLVAVFDTATRTLRYTNAGHLPGFCLSDGKSIHLDKGGIVLGVMEDYPYVEGIVQVPPDSVVIGYSDGLVEPENAYGEEFGVSRLEAAAQRVRHATPRRIAESLMTAAEEWSGSPEQADDMTVIVARLGSGSASG
ncbi:MAG TPA: SpoIIE family protein phosphatase [Candidatus Acidoferrum sp.]|nr:SpoIIE family protein phosphatase [Candidatus Acidoferrum sp.]